MKQTTIAATALLFAGCAYTNDVIRVGPETYQISAHAAPARGGQTGAQQRAIEGAAEKCKAVGKELTVQKSDTNWVFPAGGGATVTFTCT